MASARMFSAKRWLVPLWLAAFARMATTSRPQEGNSQDDQDEFHKMMEKLEKYKAENEKLKADNVDLEDKTWHMYMMEHGGKESQDRHVPASLVQTAPWALPALAAGGLPTYAAYQPVAENSLSPERLSPSVFGPPPAWWKKEQSLLQNGMSSLNSGSAGLGSGGSKQNHANYVQSKRHDSFDAFLSQMETRRRNEDIDRALNDLRGAFGDGSGNGGELLKDESQAEDAAEQVHTGVGEWNGVSKQTMEAAPEMARAVQAVAKHLESEHESLATKVRHDGQQQLEKFDESSEQG